MSASSRFHKIIKLFQFLRRMFNDLPGNSLIFYLPHLHTLIAQNIVIKQNSIYADLKDGPFRNADQTLLKLFFSYFREIKRQNRACTPNRSFLVPPRNEAKSSTLSLFRYWTQRKNNLWPAAPGARKAVLCIIGGRMDHKRECGHLTPKKSYLWGENFVRKPVKLRMFAVACDENGNQWWQFGEG